MAPSGKPSKAAFLDQSCLDGRGGLDSHHRRHNREFLGIDWIWHRLCDRGLCESRNRLEVHRIADPIRARRESRSEVCGRAVLSACSLRSVRGIARSPYGFAAGSQLARDRVDDVEPYRNAAARSCETAAGATAWLERDVRGGHSKHALCVSCRCSPRRPARKRRAWRVVARPDCSAFCCRNCNCRRPTNPARRVVLRRGFPQLR